MLSMIPSREPPGSGIVACTCWLVLAWCGVLTMPLPPAAAQVPPGLKGRSVYFEADSTPYAAGEASFLGQTLQRLHLRNVAPASLGAFPKLSPEFIVRAQPNVILATRRHVLEMPGRPGWASVKALRERQVCGFDEPTYELLIRPGPRMGEAALAIARCLAALPPASLH
jgi:iron complex transport system substrate-binding protein